MSYSQKIRMVLAYKRMSEAELARAIGTSPQSLHQRMNTDKFTSDELSKIAAAMGVTFTFSFILPTGETI